MRRKSVKKSSMFKVQAEKTVYKKYLDEVANCVTARAYPHLQAVLTILCRTSSEYPRPSTSTATTSRRRRPSPGASTTAARHSDCPSPLPVSWWLGSGCPMPRRSTC